MYTVKPGLASEGHKGHVHPPQSNVRIPVATPTLYKPSDRLVIFSKVAAQQGYSSTAGGPATSAMALTSIPFRMVLIYQDFD